MRDSRWAILFALLLFIPFPETRCVDESDSPSCNDGDIYDGGYWWGDWWVPGLISEETWRTPAPRYSVGRAVWYAAGVMAATAEYRSLSLDGYLDGVALMSPSDIGKSVYLRRPGESWEGPFLVVDCAQWEDEWPIIRYRKEVVEVGWETKQRWGMTGPIDGVEVVVARDWWEHWRVLETHLLVDYVEWWMGL